MNRRPQTSALRLVGQILRGLIGAAALLTLVGGVPWALWRYIGWPLPSHVPTWADVQAALFGAMTTTFALNVVALLCWIAWAAFVVDLTRSAVDLARNGLTVGAGGGPTRALTRMVMGAVLLAVLGNRPAPAAAASPNLSAGTEVMTSSATQHQHTKMHPVSVVVAAPHDGIHDSLSRIAHRTLGDAARWPETFHLNKGKPQPGGYTLTNPNLIYPGEELALPADATEPPRSLPPPPAASHPPPRAAPTRTKRPPRPASPAQPPTVTSESDLFIGIGVAAAISAALLVVRRRGRTRYRPGSGDRDDVPVAPIVYQLHRTHMRRDEESLAPPEVVAEAPNGSRRDLTPPVGVRDGREVAVDLASARGLGLLGDGAAPAARALLITLLTTRSESSLPATVIIPAHDLHGVIGRDARHAELPRALRVVDDVDAALDVLEAETLARAAADGVREPWPALALIASPPTQHQRLQAVLDNGAPFGVTGLILGQWQPGITCYVRGDGTISATGSGPGEALRNTRLFNLGGHDTTELLALLRRAEPDDPPSTDREDHKDLEILPPSEPRTHDSQPQPPTAMACQPFGPPATATPITITMLGPLRVRWNCDAQTSEADGREIAGALQPRSKELLVLLALHPDGTTRETLVSTLWGDEPPARPTNALHTALARMRTDLAAATDGAVTDITFVNDGHYRLDPSQVAVDYWHLERAIAAHRTAATDAERIDAYREVVNCYGGPLADGMSKIEWIEPAREAIRRDAIDAVAALARALVDANPQQTLDLLEVARTFDPHNELLYRDIMRLQERLGQLDAVPRTLALLTTRLAEIGEEPTPNTRELAARLVQRHDDHRPAPAGGKYLSTRWRDFPRY